MSSHDCLPSTPGESGLSKFSAYEVGQVVGAVAARYETNQTTPPDRFDMATILDAMLEADKFAESDADRKILKQVEGLGTSRTRQAIVDGLVSKGLLDVQTRKKRHILQPTPMAEELRDRVPMMLGSVAMTAKWELAFEMIEQGKVRWSDVADKAYEFACEVVSTAKSQKGSFKSVMPGSSVARSNSVAGKPLIVGGAVRPSAVSPVGTQFAPKSGGVGNGGRKC